MSNKPVSEALKTVLADSYTLYLKTQFFHWNVTGPHFKSLHLLFEEQYTDLQTAVDDIAERIRALGDVAPGSYKAYAKLTGIKENEDVPEAFEMVKALAKDQDTILASLQKALAAAQKAGDEASVSLVTDRIVIHEKNRWMLKSSL